MAKNKRTAGDLLFESYLRARVCEFEYEPDCPSVSTQPDYGVVLGGQVGLFEVKELNTPWPKNRVGAFDPYRPIRAMIKAAQKQFKGLKGRMCSVVLTNPRHAFAHLDPLFLCGAMLGNAGFSLPIDLATGGCEGGQTVRTFHGGGEMLRYEDGQAIEAQKTTISAVCALGHYNAGSMRLKIKIAEEKRRTRQDRLPADQLFELSRKVFGATRDVDDLHLRVVVCENPFAVTNLHRSFGSGPYDERFGVSNGRVVRLSAGASLRKLEEEASDAGLVLTRIGS